MPGTGGHGGGGAPGLWGGPGRLGPADWQAPTEVEAALYEAKTRGDWPAYFDVLASTDLYHAMPRVWADTHPGRVLWSPYWDRATGAGSIGFLTRGMLPAPGPEGVFFMTDLAGIAREWDRPDCSLAINPNSPCAAYFPTMPEHVEVWSRHVDRMREASDTWTLRTLRVGAPLEGPVAHGLACGALLCVRNGSLWNTVAWHGWGYPAERRRLDEWWGITSREQWLRCEEQLLRGEQCNPVWEFVLDIRRAIEREYGGRVETAHWREVVERVVRLRSRGCVDGADPDAEISRVQQLIGRIIRYESRFRADGLLNDGAYVRSVLAWDFGRASKMARWGLGARFCDMAEAERAFVRAGRAGQMTYDSWEEFSAGYILGRCLHFDEEAFGEWYEDMLEAHRVLTTNPDSPWLTIPFKC